MTTRINLADADFAGAAPSALSGLKFSVGKADDPYKKYWLAILAGMGFTGAWVCVPIMGLSVGSTHMSAPKPGTDAAGIEQSLDSVDNPARVGAGILDLSMGAARQSKDGGGDDMASMLYQAPSVVGMAQAAGKPLVDATAADSSESLAQQLKDVDNKKDADKSDGKNAAGWGEKAQTGFLSPHLSGGGLHGLSLSGGGSTASSSPGGANIFGSRVADPTFTAAHGLHDDGVGIRALKAAAASVANSNARASDEALHASAGRAYDGGRANGQGMVGMNGLNALGQAQVLAGQAPANLKANDPLDSKKLPSTPPAVTPPAAAQNMAQQMLMMAATTILGGLVNSLMGGGMGATPPGIPGATPTLPMAGTLAADTASAGTMGIH